MNIPRFAKASGMTYVNAPAEAPVLYVTAPIRPTIDIPIVCANTHTPSVSVPVQNVPQTVPGVNTCVGMPATNVPAYSVTNMPVCSVTNVPIHECSYSGRL